MELRVYVFNFVWRFLLNLINLPHFQLQQRDWYFTRLQDMIRTSCKINGQKVWDEREIERKGESHGDVEEVLGWQSYLRSHLPRFKVVLLGHSMGCRVIQYFLTWCERNDPS